MGVKCPNKGAKWRLLREHATLLVSNDSPNPLRSSLCLVISYRCICVFFCIAGTAYRSDLLCGKDVKDGGPCPPYENSFGPGLRTYVESGDCTNGLGESLLLEGRSSLRLFECCLEGLGQLSDEGFLQHAFMIARHRPDIYPTARPLSPALIF